MTVELIKKAALLEEKAPLPFGRPRAEQRPKPVAVAESYDVSILVVTWNSEQWIGRCLAALPAAAGRLSYEVIVYDNASTDSTAAVAERFEPQRFVKGEKNVGFSGGLNAAARLAHGRFLFFVNPDCELQAHSIETLVAVLEKQPKVGAVAPLLLGEDGAPQRSFQLRRFPTLRSLAADLLLVTKLLPRNGTSSAYRYRELAIDREQPVEQPAAAALLLRREVVDEIGDMDEQFHPAWFEDVDYCRRIWNAGHEIRLVPSAVARHRGGACLEHIGYSAFVVVWYRNLYRYAKKWLPQRDVEAIRWLTIAGMLLRIVITAAGLSNVGQSRWSTIRAYSEVIRQAFRRWDDPSASS